MLQTQFPLSSNSLHKNPHVNDSRNEAVSHEAETYTFLFSWTHYGKWTHEPGAGGEFIGILLHKSYSLILFLKLSSFT